MKKKTIITTLLITLVLLLVSCKPEPVSTKLTIKVPLFSSAVNTGARSIDKSFSEAYDFYLDWIDPVICGFESREMSLDESFDITIGDESLSVSVSEESSEVYKYTCGGEGDDVLIMVTVNQSAHTFSYYQAMRVHSNQQLSNPSEEWNYLTIVWGDNLSLSEDGVQGQIDCLFLDPEGGFGDAFNSVKASFFNTDSIRAVCFYDYIRLSSAQSEITVSSLEDDFHDLSSAYNELRTANAGSMIPNGDLGYPIYYITSEMEHVLDESGPESTYTLSSTLEEAASWVASQDKYSGWIL